jgi:GNAT superfamily N-acetyltransferase
MTACRTELTLHPDDLKSTNLQVAVCDSTVVGLAQVKVTGGDADLLKLFVEPALLRSGVGRLLFEWATARLAPAAHDTSLSAILDPSALRDDDST